MTSEANKREIYLSPDIVYSIMIIVLFVILVIQVYTYFNFKYQINKLSVLFGDFTRFYIHTSKPPCRDITNLDLLNYLNDKDSSKSSGSKSSQSDNLNKIDVINEKNHAISNFKTKFRKFKNISTPTCHTIKTKSSHPTPLPFVNLNKHINPKQGNLRRHSTFDLINRPNEATSNDKNQTKCAEYKFRHSESYSFDLANKIYSHISANDFKSSALTNANNVPMVPHRRQRLYGVSDDGSNGKRNLHAIASTSTPNR